MAIAFRDSSSATNTITGNKPAGVVSGDVMIAFLVVYDNATGALTPPSGWTEITALQGYQLAGGETLLRAAYKIAGGSEPSSYTFTMSPSGYQEVMISAYSGSFDSGVIDATSLASGNSAAPSAPSLTTSVANTMLVACFTGYNNGLSSGPAGMTQRIVNDGANYVFDVAQASAGASGAKTAAKSSDSWIAAMVALKEAGGAPADRPFRTMIIGSSFPYMAEL